MFRRAAHHLLWFPFLLLALTIILAVTIVVVDRGRENVGTGRDLSAQEGDPSVQEDEYKTSVVILMTGEWNGALRDQLVATRVPSSMRDVHIELVAMMNQHLAGLTGDPEAAADALIRWSELQAQNPWLP